MAYESVKNQIDAYIKANGVNLITGPVLNAVLTTMLDELGEGYAFQGVLDTTDTPSPAADIPQAWLASAGTYLGGSITVDEGELALIIHTSDGWSKETVYRGVQLSYEAIVAALGYTPADDADLAEKQDTIADLSAIRSGAALGSTSVQPVDIENMVEAEPIGRIVPPVNPSEFATNVQLTKNGQPVFPVTDESLVTGLNYRPYDSENPNGMGYLVLKKNKTFAEQVTEANTIYEIRYDFDLAANFTMPVGCTLCFNGGSLSGAYTLTGNDTHIEGNYRFDSVLFAGTFSSDSLEIGANFGGATDFFGILRSFSGTKIGLHKDIEITTHDDGTISTVNLNGNGHTIKVVELRFASTADIQIENCVFDCSLSGNQRTEEGFINIIGNNTNVVVLKSCRFVHVQGEIFNTYLREVKDILVEECDFSGDYTTEDTAGGRMLFAYNYVDSYVIRRCSFKDYAGVAINAIGTPSRGPIITGCTIENMGEGGIVFFGGFFTDAYVDGNIIKDTNLSESSGGAQASAINFHGYRNLQILNNQINTPNSICIDLEGSDGNTNNSGDGAFVNNNTIIGKSLSFLSSKNTIFKNNVVDLTENIQFSGKVHIAYNKMRLGSNATNTQYAILPRSTASQTFDLDGELYNNIITLRTGAKAVWLYVGNTTLNHGLMKVYDCIVTHESGTIPVVDGYDTGKLEFLDGFETRVMKIDLSAPSEEIILQRGKPGRIMSVSVHSKGVLTTTEDISVHLGLYRPSVGQEAFNYGDLLINAGAYTNNSINISLNSKTPNNETQTTTGDVYATFAGSNNTGTLYLSFVCSTGKYIMYY